MPIQFTVSTKARRPKKGEPCNGWAIEEFDINNHDEIRKLFASPMYYAHSFYQWKLGIRHKDKASTLSGIMVDLDEGLPMAEAASVLRKLNVYAILAPSRNHQKPKKGAEAMDRFHVYIPFAGPVPLSDALDNAWKCWVVDHFGEKVGNVDPAAWDRGRMMFPGLARTADQLVVIQGDVLDWEAVLAGYGQSRLAAEYKQKLRERRRLAAGKVSPPAPSRRGSARSRKGEFEKTGEFWAKEQPIDRGPDFDVVMASELEVLPFGQTHPCRCIEPGHEDEHPSAYVAWNEHGQLFVACAACQTIRWAKDWMTPYLKRLMFIGDRPWSVIGDQVCKISPQHHIVAPSEEGRRWLLTKIAQTRTYPASGMQLNRLKGGRDDARFVMADHGVDFYLPLASGAGSADDVGLFEDWVGELFGEHRDFLLRWLAVFAYANYQRLPMLVLNGPRGCGKSTWAEFLGSLYPAGYRVWDGDAGEFNEQNEGFLAHVDELPAAEHGRKGYKGFYRLTKKLTGSDVLAVNRKYGLKSQTRNNLNVVVTTNDPVPMHLEATEMPTSEANNQFFVHTMKRAPSIDLRRLSKILDLGRLWVRTKGWGIYQDWEGSEERVQARYGLNCPITAEERDTFEDSKSELAVSIDDYFHAMVVGRLADSVVPRVANGNGFVSNEGLDHFIRSSQIPYTKYYLRQELQVAGWLEKGGSGVRKIGGRVIRGYPMTDAAIRYAAEHGGLQGDTS